MRAAHDLETGFGRSFTWTCPSCDHAVADRVCAGPADDEQGRVRDRRRHAAVSAWEADWEREAIEFETGD